LLKKFELSFKGVDEKEKKITMIQEIV